MFKKSKGKNQPSRHAILGYLNDCRAITCQVAEDYERGDVERGWNRDGIDRVLLSSGGAGVTIPSLLYQLLPMRGRDGYKHI